MRCRAKLLVGAAMAFGAGVLAAAPANDHRRSPHVEIEAVGVVESDPARTVHRNGRSFEEFDVRIETARVLPDGPHSDPDLWVEKKRNVHVVHDLSCGGNWVDLKPGRHVRLKGEYVHPPHGKDIIHFTHPADSSCGTGQHADGALRASD